MNRRQRYAHELNRRLDWHAENGRSNEEIAKTLELGIDRLTQMFDEEVGAAWLGGLVATSAAG